MNEHQIMTGASLTSKDDILRKVEIDYIVKSIQNPKQEMEARINQLRMIRTIDSKQYSILKRNLPYLVCGIFNPPYRKTENFAFIQYFILDLDYISEKGFSIDDLKKKITSDLQVVLCFTSPSEDGLKVMFHLDERCYDPAIFSIFYKSFAKEFSSRYGLDQALDSKTSDVSRACFISIDRKLYYNSHAEDVKMSAYIDAENTYSLLELSNQKSEDSIMANAPIQEVAIKDPDSDVINTIKGILNPSSLKKKEKPLIYVPQQLEDIISDLKKHIEDTGLVITDIISIQYGKKIKCKTNFRTAEVNIFFGKKGFSVVTSPRSGTSPELNTLLTELIQNFVNGLYI